MLFNTDRTTTPEQVSPTPTSKQTNEPTREVEQITPSPIQMNSSDAHGETILFETAGKEVLTDGSIKYTRDSGVVNRPNITITQGGEQNVVFERSVIAQKGEPVLLSDYLELFGQPEKIIKGSRFYGPEAALYFYSARGLAFIANPQTNRVFEIHSFPLIDEATYIKKYGDDILK